MPHRFLIHEFATKAGVTVKALHLYDRLGLLVPVRSEAGHRLYSTADLSRVRRIVTLKRLGVPLRRVGPILDSSGLTFQAILQNQRRALEDRRDGLDGLIRALHEDEGEPAMRGPSEVLDALFERLAIQDGIDAMRQYYPPQVWPLARRYYEPWPSETWRQLHHDVTEALDVDPALDPASEIAQSFATRWLALDAEDAAPPGVRLGHRRAWAHRGEWPEALRARLTERERGRAARFVAGALWERWDAERVTRKHHGGVRERVSDVRRRLYRDGSALLGRAPSSSAVQDLRARWEAILDEEVAGDTEMKAEMVEAFKGRRRWPAGLVRSMAASYEIEPATWSRVADLIEAAHNWSVSPGIDSTSA